MADPFQLLYSALDSHGTVQLWSTDGTQAGTAELTAVANLSAGLYPGQITVLDAATAAFTGLDATDHTSLWTTDGTASGTHELAIAHAFTNGIDAKALIGLNGQLLFTGTDAAGHTGVWTSDGTSAGTTELLQLADLGPAIVNPQSLISGGQAWFEIAGRLVVSDGTASGTRLLASGLAPPDAGPTIAALDGGILFSANHQLWRSDGTDTTALTAAISPTGLTTTATGVLFRGVDATGNTQLWTSDGTTTTALTSFTSGAHTSYPLGITAFGTSSLFFATDANFTQQLWTTDGTLAGTGLVTTIDDTAPDAITTLTEAGGDIALFTTAGGLWRSDGTRSGTTLLKGATSGPGPALSDGTALFASRGAILVSDGTQAGTHSLIAAAYATDLTLLSAGIPPITSDAPPPCFLPGTRILTEAGDLAVEALRPGQRVHTATGWHPIRWIGRGQAPIGGEPDHPARPVLIEPGALGPGIPARRLAVTQGHCLHFPDGAAGLLVPAALLVNGTSIRLDLAATEVTYYHLALDHHDVILAEGAACETWRDDGTHPAFDTPPPPGLGQAPPCAPKLAYGAAVIAIWQALRDIAGLPPPAGAPDPDLHLIADGRPVLPDFQRGTCYRFTLPRRPLDLRIASRTTIPAETGLGPDLRRLGIGVQHIAFAQHGNLREIAALDPSLADGFHPPTGTGTPRWTKAATARLDTTRLRLARGEVRVQITAIGLAAYAP